MPFTADQSRRGVSLSGIPESGIPDVKYIRDCVSIKEVAISLGVEVCGKAAHCWRIDNHRRSDRTPSIWFTRRNRGQCQVCDTRPWSNIDLVMLMKGVSLVEAIAWIAERSDAPRVSKGKHLVEHQRWTPRFRVGTADDLMEPLVRSGLLALLNGAELKVLEVLRVFFSHDDQCTKISYLGIMRYSGIGSSATIRAALRQLQKLQIIEISRGAKDGFRACNSYRFTLDSPEFLAIATTCDRKNQELAQVERTLRAQQRRKRDIYPGITSVQKVKC